MQRKRLLYYTNLRTTSHWANRIRVNGLQGQSYGNERLVIPYDRLRQPDLERFDEEARKLMITIHDEQDISGEGLSTGGADSSTGSGGLGGSSSGRLSLGCRLKPRVLHELEGVEHGIPFRRIGRHLLLGLGLRGCR